MLPLLLSNYTVTVSIKKFLQVGYLLPDFVTLISVSHTKAPLIELDYLRSPLNVGSVAYSFLGRSKWLMLNELESAAVIYKRVTGYSRVFMVSP